MKCLRHFYNVTNDLLVWPPPYVYYAKVRAFCLTKSISNTRGITLKDSRYKCCGTSSSKYIYIRSVWCKCRNRRISARDATHKFTRRIRQIAVKTVRTIIIINRREKTLQTLQKQKDPLVMPISKTI